MASTIRRVVRRCSGVSDSPSISCAHGGRRSIPARIITANRLTQATRQTGGEQHLGYLPGTFVTAQLRPHRLKIVRDLIRRLGNIFGSQPTSDLRRLAKIVLTALDADHRPLVAQVGGHKAAALSDMHPVNSAGSLA